MKTTLIALAALMISGVAMAQSTDPGLNGVSIRLGIAFPLDNRLQNTNDSLTSIGIEFQSPSSFSRGTENYLALEYYSKTLGTFGKGSIIPVTYNVRFMKTNNTGRQTYAFGGLGFCIVDVAGPSETVVMARGGLGMNLSDHTFVEAAATLSAATNNGSFNTIGLSFGYRF